MNERTMWRKKPVTIEAVQWSGYNTQALLDWIEPKAREDGSDLVIPTLEGDHRASIGDWIVKGVKGEFYPCNPDIFAMTYERVSEQRCAECDCQNGGAECTWINKPLSSLTEDVSAMLGCLQKPLLGDLGLMKQWDEWRRYISEGGAASHPRDSFEALLDSIDEERSDAADLLERLARERDSLLAESTEK